MNVNQYANKYYEMKKETLKKVQKKEITKIKACEILRTSRPTLNVWLSRFERFGEEGLLPQKRKEYPSAHNKTNDDTEDIIVSLAEKYWMHGVETLSDYLFAEHQIYKNPTTIWRILKRKKARYTDNYNGTKKRTKKKLYSHKIPGQELQMDTKYPFGYKIGVVAYTIIEDSSRWAYSKMYSTANADNTLDFLNEVFKRMPFDILKIRTDCGTEFVNRKVTDLIISMGIVHRKNTPYCPEENGKIERFHRTLNEKAISISWSPQDSLQTLQYKLELFLHWYNFKKRHRGLGMNRLTPFSKLIHIATQNGNSFEIKFPKNVNLTLQCNKS